MYKTKRYTSERKTRRIEEHRDDVREHRSHCPSPCDCVCRHCKAAPCEACG